MAKTGKSPQQPDRYTANCISERIEKVHLDIVFIESWCCFLALGGGGGGGEGH